MAKIRKENNNCQNNLSVEERRIRNIIDNNLIDDNVISFRDIQDKLVAIYAKKNHDYGDSFNQGCDELGVGYAFSRIYDKTKRFQTLAKGIMTNSLSMEVQDETIDDTLMDLANYCVMYLAWKGYTDKHECLENSPKGSDYDVDDKVYIDIKPNINNDVVKLVHEGTDFTCTHRVLKNYGDRLVKDNNNYVYIENADGSFTSVTDEFYLVKVVPNK